MWMIGRHVIKAVLNEDPLGCHPFYRTSYVKTPGPGGGRAAETISDAQAVCNAVAVPSSTTSAWVRPHGRDQHDRLAPGESSEIWPGRSTRPPARCPTGKRHPVLSAQDGGRRAHPGLCHLLQDRDEHCGVPSYAHGDPRLEEAETRPPAFRCSWAWRRGDQRRSPDLDIDIVEPAIEAQYYMNYELDDAANISAT